MTCIVTDSLGDTVYPGALPFQKKVALAKGHLDNFIEQVISMVTNAFFQYFPQP